VEKRVGERLEEIRRLKEKKKSGAE